MKLNELPVLQEIKDNIQASFDLASGIIKKGEEFLPQLLLSNIVKGESTIIVSTFSNEDEKNKFVRFAKDTAIKMKADLSIFTAESYKLENDDAREYQGNLAKYKYSMANHPNKKEIVMFSIETLFQKIMGFAKIIEENNKRCLGEIEFMNPQEVEGRMLGFLSR